MSGDNSAYQDYPWWEAATDSEEPHRRLVPLMQQVRLEQITRLDNTARLISIYEWGYRASSGYRIANHVSSEYEPPMADEMLWFNPLKNTVDTVHAKVCKQKIIPMALSMGGTYHDRRVAKDRTKALEAEFDKNKYDAIEEKVVKDALVPSHGAGAIKVMWPEGEVKYEHVPIEQLFVHDVEGRHGTPRSLFQIAPVDRWVLLHLYGGKESDLYGDPELRRIAIRNAPQSNHYGVHKHHMVDVFEAWHLPSGKGATDGRHTIAIEGCTLVDEPWEWPCFPFAFYIPRPRLRSFWGLSLAYDLASAQRAHEHASDRLQRAVKRMGGTHIVARKGSTNPDEWDNDQGTFIETENGPGDVSAFNPELFNPQMMQWFESLPRYMANYRGLSEMSTSGQMPAGLINASGKALQTYIDEDNEGLIAEHRAKERLAVEVAKLTVYAWGEICRCQDDEEEETEANDNGREESAEGPYRTRGKKSERKGYRVRYRSKNRIEHLDVRELMNGEDEWGEEPQVAIFPVSQLAKTPAARFDQLKEMLNAGAITIEQFKRLFEMPDLEAENEIDTADVDAIDDQLDRMVYLGEYEEPDSFFNFVLAKERARKFLNVCRRMDVPDERVQLVRDWITAIDLEIQNAALASQAHDMLSNTVQSLAGAGGGPGGPPGAGGPPPGSPPGPSGPPPMPGAGGPPPMAA